MNVPVNRRGWCPGIRRPMATGDGLLVRIHPPGGVLKADQARILAEAAQEYGNGLLDVTARGNLQIRGVSEKTYPELLAQLNAMNLVEAEGEGPRRLTVVSPLAGLDPHDRIDALALSEALEQAARSLQGLPPKVFVAVDGGGSMPLDDIGADLYLMATGRDEARAVALGLASPGGVKWIGVTSLAQAPAAAISALKRFSAMRQQGLTEARRLWDLPPELAHELSASVLLENLMPEPKRPMASRAGLFNLRNREVALLAALPFGRCSGTQLAQAAAWSERFGNAEIRLSFTRGFLLPGLTHADVAALEDEARRSGFITDANDPRLAVVACPGRPACGSARTPAPQDAMRLAEAAGTLLTGGVQVHVSGCSKGCAHPGAAGLTLVGGENEAYGVVVGGNSRDDALTYLSIEEIMARLSNLKSPNDLGRLFGKTAQ